MNAYLPVMSSKKNKKNIFLLLVPRETKKQNPKQNTKRLRASLLPPVSLQARVFFLFLF